MDRAPFRLSPRGRQWFDIALTCALLAVAPLAAVGISPGTAVLTAAQIAPLFWRRSHPVAVFAAVYVTHAAQVLLYDTTLPGQLAFPIAVYSVARWRGLRWSIPVLVLSLIAAVVAAIDWMPSYGTPSYSTSLVASQAFGIGLIVVVAWVLGLLGHTREAYVNSLIERSERVAREADQRAQLAAQGERNRIAREMHDVVAHGLSVIIVQADGARYAASARPETAVDALETIASTGRQALTEMRSLLGLLRENGTGTAPQPDLADVPALLEEAAASMRLDTEISADLAGVPPGVALTAYRLLQESLTNVRKHAGPQVTTTVTLRRDGDVLNLTVRDDGRGASAADDGGGHGLVGMRERVAAHGGELRVGPVVGGGYEVDARIPW
ncbi:sensor histidine kinase [Aeromicrobium sp. YIM 150415]|uniref:sensor histidine kinase n=1 Tax=Aeromicrobium sp. YIM 150415 TaxID=2803912 RepID=UPI0019646BBE|nr:sensor histidine kinase [Aeromicrobium sp. YIM 150415]MBM9465461.1 sensor histidine kinase [Aeromicrobium sp. YIM 150415]